MGRILFLPDLLGLPVAGGYRTVMGTQVRWEKAPGVRSQHPTPTDSTALLGAPLSCIKLSHLILIVTLQLDRITLHFTGGETEAQRGEMTCPRPHSYLVGGEGLEPT